MPARERRQEETGVHAAVFFTGGITTRLCGSEGKERSIPGRGRGSNAQQELATPASTSPGHRVWTQVSTDGRPGLVQGFWGLHLFSQLKQEARSGAEREGRGGEGTAVV